MPSLQELKDKYKFECEVHEPNPDCKFCKGAGERPIKSRPEELHFCICLFCSRDISDEAGTLLGEFAKKQLDKMGRCGKDVR